MGQSVGAEGQNYIAGSPMGGMRVLSQPEVQRYTSPQYDPYTAMRRPNYMPYGPNQQFYQPIYQPSYSQFSPFGYGQAPFGGFYQPPMMGMMGRGRGLQMGGQRMGVVPGNMATNYGNFDSRFAPQQSNMFGGQATYLTNQFQPMLSPQPMQSQYRPIPYMTQSQIDTRNAAAAAAAAPPPNIYEGSGGGYGDGGVGGDGGGVGMGAGSTGEGVFKKGGNVDDGIASLLKK